MESIKHKMTILAKETEAANQRTREATAAAQMEEEKAENFEDEVLKAQKKVSIVEFKRKQQFNSILKVAKLEEELDQTMTTMRIAQESAEESDKQIVDWELQITALSRRLTLLVSLYLTRISGSSLGI